MAFISVATTSTYPIKTRKKGKTHNKQKILHKMAEVSSNLLILKNPSGLNLPIWNKTPALD